MFVEVSHTIKRFADGERSKGWTGGGRGSSIRNTFHVFIPWVFTESGKLLLINVFVACFVGKGKERRGDGRRVIQAE